MDRYQAKTVIEALGHDWGEWEIVEDPTADSLGTRRRVCNRDEEHVEEKQDVALITWDLAGGTLGEETGTITEIAYVGDEITVKEAPTKAGYRFLYWEGSKHYPGDSYTVEDSHTFTAVYEEVGVDTGDHSALDMYTIGIVGCILVSMIVLLRVRKIRV